MRKSKMVIYILLSVLLVILLLMSISIYISLRPPKSVILVALRMPYQILSTIITILCMIGIVIYFMIVLLKCRTFKPFSLVLVFGFLTCSILGIIYSARINGSKSIQNGITYKAYSKGKYEVDSEDLKEVTQMKQCYLSTPKNSENAKTCVVYVNYGGWSSQESSMGNYLKTVFNNNGYSFAKLAGIGRETGKIDEMVKDVKKGITLLKKEKDFEKIILVGTSAGGTISLLVGYSNFGEDINIDGIVAMYPIANISNAYDYYANAKSSSFLDKLGDKIYCSLYKTGKDINTFALASNDLFEQAFGKKDGTNTLYDDSLIENSLNKNIPTLLIAGSIDSMALTNDTFALFNKMKEKNIICSYLELPYVEHAFDIADTTARKRAIKEMENFVNTLIKG